MGFPNILFLFKSVGPSHGKNDGFKTGTAHGNATWRNTRQLFKGTGYFLYGGNFWPRRTVCKVNGRN